MMYHGRLSSFVSLLFAIRYGSFLSGITVLRDSALTELVIYPLANPLILNPEQSATEADSRLKVGRPVCSRQPAVS